MWRTATPEESLEKRKKKRTMNSFSMYPRFSDPCRAHIHLMGLTGLEGPGGRWRGVKGSEVTDRGGPEVQHWDVRVLRLTGAE